MAGVEGALESTAARPAVLRPDGRWGRRARFTNGERGKDILLQVAIDSIIRYGARNTTMQHIAVGASVSRRTVYRYFPDRQCLLEEAFVYARSRAFAEMKTAATPYADDFSRFFEECVVTAVSFYRRLASAGEQAMSDWPEKPVFFRGDDFREGMRKLLYAPYRSFLERAGDRGGKPKLEDFIEVGRVLMVAHSELNSSSATIRESVHRLSLFPV